MMTRPVRALRAGAAPLLAAAALAVLATAPLSAGTVDFDSVAAAPGGTLFPGNTFAADGVVFRSASIPNFVFVGQNITLSGVDGRLMVLGNGSAISNPNFGAASGVFTQGSNDLLMTFSAPVDSVSVVTDDAVETPDTVRLLALRPNGSGGFVITAIKSGADNAVSAPSNVLTLDLTGKATQFVLFQVTTEAEGIDNVRWSNPPDCGRQGGRIDPGCFEVPPYEQWVPVGCEIVDCCPFCPGIFDIDWVINVAGDPFDVLVLRFEDLTREAAAHLQVDGNAVWSPEEQTLEIRGAGQVTLKGLPAVQGGLKWTAASPRMTLDRIDAAPGTGAPRALRVKVSQQVGGGEISDSSLVYTY
jgi:hypothetical protein